MQNQSEAQRRKRDIIYFDLVMSLVRVINNISYANGDSQIKKDPKE